MIYSITQITKKFSPYSYEYIVEENLEAGRKIYKKLQGEEEIDRENDEREADDILLAMENDNVDTGAPLDETNL